MVAFDALLQHRGQQLYVLFEADAFADLDEVLTAYARAEFRIVQQQIRELRSLLHQVQLGHSRRFPLKLGGWNTYQFAQYVTRIIEGQRLVEITCK